MINLARFSPTCSLLVKMNIKLVMLKGNAKRIKNYSHKRNETL